MSIDRVIIAQGDRVLYDDTICPYISPRRSKRPVDKRLRTYDFRFHRESGRRDGIRLIRRWVECEGVIVQEEFFRP